MIVVSGSEFQEALERVGSTANQGKTSSNDLTSFIKMKAQDGSLELSSSNYRSFSSAKITAREGSDNDSFICYCPVSIILEHVKMIGGQIKIFSEKNNGGITLEFYNNKSLFVKNKVISEEDDFFFEINDKVLERHKTFFTVNQSDFREYLEYVYTASGCSSGAHKIVKLSNYNGFLAMTATDGFRMALAKNIVDTEEEFDISVSTDEIRRMLKFLIKEENNITIRFNKGKLFVVNGDYVFGCLLSSTELDVFSVYEMYSRPDYISISIDRDYARKVFNVSQTFAEAGSGRTNIMIIDSGVTAVTESNEAGKTEWILENDANKDVELFVPINPLFVLSWLGTDRSKKLKLSLSEDKTPFYIDGDDEKKVYFAMPYAKK